MFTNILFLILVLLLINLAPADIQSVDWIFSPWNAALLGVALYAITVGAIYLQNKVFSRFVRKHKSRMLFIVELELLCFLACYQFFLGVTRIFSGQPFQIVPILVALSLYFLGLIIFYVTYPGRRSFAEVLIVIPFTIPFLFIVFFFDLLQLFPSHSFQDFLVNGGQTTFEIFLFYGMILSLLIILMIFMPYLIQKIWNCKPLDDSLLKTRLDEICQKAHFRHAGFKTWTVLNDSLTAAIIGIVPRWRYILFTRRLLNELSPNAIEAILAHEIGHNYHRHLLIYPFILFGISVTLSYVSWLILPFMESFFGWGVIDPSQVWVWINPFMYFFIYAATIVIYFRIVFGLFSRLFERQADLHVFILGIPVQYMIEALEYIGIATGHTYLPNWHHYGIHQRIDFLKAVMHNPNLIEQHHKRVRRYVVSYFIILVILIMILFIF